jgi:hypothetical protein
VGKNMASIYSLRPLPGAPVSVPLRWPELEYVYPPDFNIDTVPGRFEEVGDIWAGILDAKHDLTRSWRRRVGAWQIETLGKAGRDLSGSRVRNRAGASASPPSGESGVPPRW